MTDVITLKSYGADRWLPAGDGKELVSAIDGTVVARMPDQANVGEMVDYARSAGGPALRAMTFQQRGKMLRALADALTARKEELYALSAFTGATRNDSAFDIEGGIGALFVYSSKARSLPDAHVMLDGGRETISKGDFLGQHILAPLTGVAVHINAYNFPVWGRHRAEPVLHLVEGVHGGGQASLGRRHCPCRDHRRGAGFAPRGACPEGMRCRPDTRKPPA
jgi:oxepin-CoA hydrolase/3-oxo-5,6-dehydrosuberyl-CoA semialdehyde dehydrogenase